MFLNLPPIAALMQASVNSKQTLNLNRGMFELSSLLDVEQQGPGYYGSLSEEFVEEQSICVTSWF